MEKKAKQRVLRDESEGAAFSRRNFLKRAGAVGASVAAAAALAGCSPAAGGASDQSMASTGDAGSWDKEADVVVVGSGGSAWGALRAAELGASVVLVEKSTMFGGTCALSGAAFWVPNNYSMAEKDLTDSREDAVAYLDFVCEGKSTPEMQERYIDASNEWMEWAATFGYKWETIEYFGNFINDYYYPAAPGSTTGRSMWADLVASTKNITGEDYTPSDPNEGRGPQTWKLLHHLVEQAGVEVMMNTEATHLVRNGAGEVVGITAEKNGKAIRIGAGKAVILGAGGMDHNAAMRKAFLRIPLACTKLTKECTGDGHRMGMEIGANLQNMSSFYGGSVFMPKDFEVGDEILNDQNGPLDDGGSYRGLAGAIVVNRRGRRFANESAAYAAYARSYEGWDTGSMQWENLPSYFICDDKVVQNTVMPGGMTEPGQIPDFFVRADTLEELAEQLDIDPAGLAAQVEEFNGYAAAGVDDQWDRPAAALAPLDTPPFYGARQWANSLGTAGGLDIDVNAQVMDVNGNLIPRLYAVGCNGASPFGSAYPAGGAPVASGSVMSYVAVNHALGNA